jgi:hypothetical protein
VNLIPFISDGMLKTPEASVYEKSAAYVGSVASGLGFYNIEVPEVEEKEMIWISLNVGFCILRLVTLQESNCSWSWPHLSTLTGLGKLGS